MKTLQKTFGKDWT